MLHKLLPLRTLAAVLTALLLVGGIQASASATTRRSLSISVSPTGAAVRTPVRFAGTLSRSPRGTRVMIQRRIGTRWVTSKTTRTTTARGTYAVSVTLPSSVGTYSYRAFAARTSRLAAAASRTLRVAALTQAYVSLTASPTSLTAGNSTTLAGAVYPFVKNTLVTVQRRSGTTWVNVTSTPLSAGGTFSRAVGVVTTTTFRVTVPRVGSYSPAVSREQVVTAKPAIATGSLPSGTRLATYSTTLTTVGGIKGTWTASPLPAGLALNAATGVISGTPTAVGDTSVVIGFTQTGGPAAASKTLNLHIGQATSPVISTTSLPNGTRLSSYTTTLIAAGNPAGTWTVSQLPHGLSMPDPHNGVILGTPDTIGDTNVVVGFTQTNTGLSAAPKTLGLHVNQAAAPVITTSSLPRTDQNSSYGPVQLTVSTTGNPAGTWTATPLPAGLSVDSATGIISGTVSAGANSANVAINFTQTSTGLGAAPVTLFLQVGTANNPVIATSSLPDGTRTLAYTASLTAAGGATGTWTAAPLPAGVTIDPTSGVISGTPSAVGSTDVVIGFTQTSSGPGNGLSAASKTLTLHVNEAPAPVISTSSLPIATRLTPYTTTLTATGNPAGTWTATPLPAGLSLNATTGVISGTPTGTGSTDVVIGFSQTSTGLASNPKTLPLQVNQAAPPVISTGSLPDGTRGTVYTTTLTATGNPPGTWSATPLPAGLVLDPNTGIISGTPTATGDTNVVIGFTQTDSGLAAAPKTLTLHVNEATPPVIATSVLPSANRFRAYSTQLTTVGGQAGTWSASPLPAGLSLDPSSGVISGIPNNAGDTSVTINFTQTSTGLAATSKTLVLHVNQDTPVIATTSLPNGAFFQPYSVQLQTVGSPVGTWSTSTSPLPLGLGFHSDGTLTGTPLTTGDFVIKVTFKETSTGLSSTEVSLNLHIS
ncbi:MAG: Ig family protein [Marmoricola sp.]|nr:Ig family protein [Marmoricola sp.]